MTTNDFALGTHNGRITITNPATGQHRTFLIRTQKQDADFAPGERLIGMLTGPDNENDYQFFGFVKAPGRIVLWNRCRTDFYEAVARMIENPERYEPRGIQYEIEGHCRRCNRLLTVPESIQTGIGPTCAGRERHHQEQHQAI
jgi:hypothetical protein